MTTKMVGRPKGELSVLLAKAKSGETFLLKNCSQNGAYVISKRLGTKIRTEKTLCGSLRIWVDKGINVS